ncbi:glycosyltransferase family 2 protein [Flavobacterium sp. ACN6]|uniref:glycosyltransferase family 2 protein n=1 Tax=Flavobacterium sp. ACN6 TaxID=1920426 RepID=UPI000BB3DEF7|nr:glycosyltransferase family 2 protein [Flavobacterium sp. ACN6]PBJ13852.1 putative teichuronic acid biosynthesis glycosyltransferase TuaG [Flavobacterium sp. ACN6]
MNSNFPLISVIVPNYNHENYLRLRLDSIFNQTYQNFEVILLDDCSTDGSRNILSEYAEKPQVKYCVFNDKNSGNTFRQWKKGIDLSAGDFIWIAESDDFCDIYLLERVVKPLINDNKVVLSYCQSNKVDENNNKIGNWIEHTNSLDKENFKKDFIIEGDAFIEKYLIHVNVIPNASAVLLRKKNLFLSADLLTSNDLRTCGDWIVYVQQIIGFKVAFTADSLNNFRYHSNSVIAKTVKSDEKTLIVDINLKMRKAIFSILRIKRPSNYEIVFSKNKSIIKFLKYEKGLLLIRSSQKLKGMFILISVLDEFIKRYKFRKNLKLKLKKLGL